MTAMHSDRLDPVWSAGQILSTPIGEVTLERQLGAGKSGYSHLAQQRCLTQVPRHGYTTRQLNSDESLLDTPEERFVVAKRMHDEPTPFYTFSDDKVALEYRAYVKLKRIGVPVPTMLHINPEKEYLIKEYVPGPDGLLGVRDGIIDDEIIRELRLLSDLCREESINLDWFPANFVVLPANGEEISFGEVGAGPRITKRLAYIDYELNEYSDEWSFEEWGIWYWANREGVSAFLDTGDSAAINDPPESGKPIRTHQDVVQRWLTQ